MSLRAELVGAGTGYPGFAVLLPPGWEAIDAEFTGVDSRVDRALSALPIAARQSARRRVDDILASARAQAARGDVIRSFVPSADHDDVAPPVTLVASWLTAPGDGTASGLGAEVMARFGARPFDPAGTILRWSLDQTMVEDGGTAEISGAGYLLRVPGKPKTALVFRSTILHGVGGDVIAQEGIDAMSLLCDAIVASVRWRHDA